MGYESEIEDIARLGEAKSITFKTHKLSTVVGGLQAGAYVGIAIILILTLGAVAPASVQPLIMGGTFGLALILVVIGGAELFTGYNLYTAVAINRKHLNWGDALSLNAFIFFANLLGAVLLVTVYWFGQGPLTHGAQADFVQSVASKKMHLSASALIARGMLCNWLVCLALWMAKRVNSDSAKCIVIAWCLLAFIAAGFEHSVANMTVHLLALAGPDNVDITLLGAMHNLLWVTIGNVIGGAVFVGLAYSCQTNKPPTSTNEIS